MYAVWEKITCWPKASFDPSQKISRNANEMDVWLIYLYGVSSPIHLRTKPFSVEELLARLRVTKRRLAMLQANANDNSSIFVNGELKIDYVTGCAYLGDEELHLTPIEYKLLCLMSQNIGRVLTHTYITQNVWGSSWDKDVVSLRVFMATLRKKLENR